MGLIDKVNVEVNGSGDLLSTLSTYTTKILKPNIVDGKNILTQAMISSKNTKYVIKYNYELSEDITIPDNCVLEFDGGSISNGTIDLNNVFIDCDSITSILKTSCIGTISNATIYPEWFYISGDWKTAIQTAVNCCKVTGCVLLSSNEYYLGDSFTDGSAIIVLKQYIKFISNTKSRLYTRATDSGKGYVYMVHPKNHCVIEGVFFDQSEEVITNNTDTLNLLHFCIGGGGFDDVIIRNCYFTYFSNAIQFNARTGGKITTDSCTFKFFRMPNMQRTDYDTSAIYLRGGEFTTINNVIIAENNITYKPHGGIELHGFNHYCAGNIIQNCVQGIYCVNDLQTDSVYYDDDYKSNGSLIIEGNAFKNVTVAFDIWAMNKFSDGSPLQDMEHILISGNIGWNVEHIVNFWSDEEMDYSYNDINIIGNSFVSPGTLTIPTSWESTAFRRGTVISIDVSSAVKKLVISNNIFDGYCGLISTAHNYTPEIIEIEFSNNICRNVLNYNLTHTPNGFDDNACFTIRKNTTIKIFNNVIEFNENNNNLPRIISALSQQTVVYYKGNKIVGLKGDVTADNTVLVYIKNNATVYLDDKPTLIKTQNDKTYNANDLIINTTEPSNIEINSCYERGTDKVSTFTTGKIVKRGYYGYIICDNIEQIDVNDYITITADRVPKVKEKVLAKIGNKIYTSLFEESSFASGDFNSEVSISSLIFPAPVIYSSSKMKNGTYDNRPNGWFVAKGLQYFNTENNRVVTCKNVSGGTAFYVDYDGADANVKREGVFANKPNSSDIYVGFRYFCTDRQTIEGATNGIEIIHKGNDVWVDALGRVVS